MQGIALQAVAFGLTATISWDFPITALLRSQKKLGGFHSALLVCVFAAVVYDLIFLILLRSHLHFESAAALYAVIAGLSYTAAMASFYKGLEHGPVSIVSPLGSLYPLVTTMLLVIFFGNHLSAMQILGICVVALGVTAASGIFDKVHSGRRLSIGPILGLIAAICWGINFALLARSIDRIGWQSATLIQQSCSAVVFISVLPFIANSGYKIIPRLHQVRRSFLIGAAILQVIGFLALTVGIGRVGDLASIAVAVSACYPVITVFLALRNLGEKFEPVPIIGALTSVIGIIILSIG